MAEPEDLRAWLDALEAQVEVAPDAPAVACNDEALSYRELNRRANRLARLLADHGVGPDVVVALLGQRGVDYLTAIVALLQAGRAYLPPRPPAPLADALHVITLRARDRPPAHQRQRILRALRRQPRPRLARARWRLVLQQRVRPTPPFQRAQRAERTGDLAVCAAPPLLCGAQAE